MQNIEGTIQAYEKTIARLKDILASEVMSQEIEKVNIENNAYNYGYNNAMGLIRLNILEKKFTKVEDVMKEVEKILKGDVSGDDSKK